MSGWPYISLLILMFLNINGCISVKTSLINTKLGDFVNLGVVFLTKWISIPIIIYRRVSSPFQCEIRQYMYDTYTCTCVCAYVRRALLQQILHAHYIAHVFTMLFKLFYAQ